MGKKKREEIWCTNYTTEGHHKNECLTYRNYLAMGAPNTLPTRGISCEIFRGNYSPTVFLTMHEYVSTPTSLYCEFSK